jgi:hypothetical protein
LPAEQAAPALPAEQAAPALSAPQPSSEQALPAPSIFAWAAGRFAMVYAPMTTMVAGALLLLCHLHG